MAKKSIEKKFEKNSFAGIKENEEYLTPEKIINTWVGNVIGNTVSKSGEQGLRSAQIGALSSIRAHWTVSKKDATIVMPTGTGKTETMMATILSEQVKKTLVLVPSKLLRNQTYEKFKTLGVLSNIGYVNSEVLQPNTLKLESNFKNFNTFKFCIDNSNVIISTISLIERMETNQFEYLINSIDLLILDESHHVSAKSWTKVKNCFLEKRILQFTATPFRADGKKVDGDIIYNFPLSLAQEQGYFKEIEFIAIEEFNEQKSDAEIAKKAVALLETDIKEGYNHLLLVRAKSLDRAEELYNSIYKKDYSKYNPVLITSREKEKLVKERIKSLKELSSRIVVCVDMFGEGIDIPNLKVLAMHDKYKSMPITLQFIGRFARNQEHLGKAKIVTNIADNDIVEAMEDLYTQDTNWNKLLPQKTETYIGKEINFQKFMKEFGIDEFNEISLPLIRLKISMMAYVTKDEVWNYNNWIDIFDESKCKHFLNKDKNVLIIVEPRDVKVGWTTQQNIFEKEWHLFVLYWNKDKNVLFLNSTDRSKGYLLVNKLFETEPITIKSDKVFKCFHGIKRLMLGTVGLNSAVDGPVRYKMFAGIDVAQGISESQKGKSFKSNLFGHGYMGDGKISIGASHKGTIWSRWIESIDYWMNWCDSTIDKVLDENINIEELLKGVLIPKVVSSIPEVQSYRIDWPMNLDYETERRIVFESDFKDFSMYEMDIKLEYDLITKESIIFSVGNELCKEQFKLLIHEDNYNIISISKSKMKIKIGNNKSQYLYQFFKEEPPTIWFVDGASLQGNVLVEIPKNQIIQFPIQNIIKYDWTSMGVNIKIESQFDSKNNSKINNSIQYKMIEKMIESEEYTIIFDDDGSGEIADIVGIKEHDDSIVIDLFHCKYSHGEKPGSRIKDLYEVCGQAEKSVFWKQKTIDLLDRIKSREGMRLAKNKISRFELGNLQELAILKKKLLRKKTDMNIFVVQPGVSSSKITPEMNSVLATSHSFCLDTFGIDLKLICSD